MTLQESIMDYKNILALNHINSKASILERMIATLLQPFTLIWAEVEIDEKIAEMNIFDLLKEYRIMHLGQFGKNKSYNPLVSIHESMGYNCLDIYIKYKYVIKFFYNTDNTYISIDGNYSEANKALITIPEDIEQEIRRFIKKDISELLYHFKHFRR